MPEKLFEFITLEGLEAFKEESEAQSGSAYATKMMISQNADTGVVTFKLYSSDNTLLDTKTLDLDTEHIIKSVSLDYANKKLIFTMNDDSTIETDISDLIDGLKGEIQDVADDLADEVSRATTKEGQLETAIGNEETRAKGVENSKADKVANGVENDIVLLDANGNIKDSGKSINDVGKVATVSVGGGTPIQPDQDKNIDLPAYPTRASLAINNVDNTSDINKPVSTAQQTAIDSAGHKIDLEINSTNFKMVAKLYDKNNTLLSTSTEIDLPLESVVVSGAYDSQTKKVILTLQNGSTIEFSVADLINGLQTTIDAQHKLSSDLVDDAGNTNKFVTQSEKTLWNSKVNAYEVADITALTTAQVNTLKVGDVVVKNENGNKHNYIVTYKENEVGICLTYTDTDNVETVSYDYLNNEWTYNSTDITKIVVELSREERFGNNWLTKSWVGSTSFTGSNVWKDNDGNIYFSTPVASYQLVNGEWVEKVWTGATSLLGSMIWKDGENIYHSFQGTTKQLINGEWVDKVWTGLTISSGSDIWHDLDGNTYYSDSNNHKQLINGEWVNKTWTGYTSFDGSNIWQDNDGNIYYSSLTNQYYLDGNEWKPKTWTGLTSFFGRYVWTDGNSIYFSNGSNQYYLDGNEWKPKTWTGLTSFKGDSAWQDNDGNIYYSNTNDQYQLQKETIIHKGDLDDVKAEVDGIKNGEELNSFADVEEALENMGAGVVALSTASGTLTQAQLTELQKDVAIIKYSNRLFYKQTASGNTRYFYDENIILANTKENYCVKTYENGKAYYCLYRTYPRKNTYIITPTSQNPEQSFNNAISQGYQISEAIPNPNIAGSWTYNPEAIYYSIVQPKVSIDINNARYHYHEDVLRDIYDKENIDALLDPKNNIIELPDNVTTGVLTNVNIEKLSTNIIIRSNLAYTYVKQETQTIDPPVRGETDQTTYISGKKYVLSQDLTTWYTPADLGYSDDDFDEYLFNYFIEEEGFHIRVLIDSAQIYTYHNITYDSTNNCYKIKKIEISFTDGLTWTYSEEADVYAKTQVDTLLNGKQPTLVSGTNIKTINNQSLLGSGDISMGLPQFKPKSTPYYTATMDSDEETIDSDTGTWQYNKIVLIKMISNNAPYWCIGYADNNDFIFGTFNLCINYGNMQVKYDVPDFGAWGTFTSFELYEIE